MPSKPTKQQIWDEELGYPIHTESTPIKYGELRTEVYLWKVEGERAIAAANKLRKINSGIEIAIPFGGQFTLSRTKVTTMV